MNGTLCTSRSWTLWTDFLRMYCSRLDVVAAHPSFTSLYPAWGLCGGFSWSPADTIKTWHSHLQVYNYCSTAMLLSVTESIRYIRYIRNIKIISLLLDNYTNTLYWDVFSDTFMSKSSRTDWSDPSLLTCLWASLSPAQRFSFIWSLLINPDHSRAGTPSLQGLLANQSKRQTWMYERMIKWCILSLCYLTTAPF